MTALDFDFLNWNVVSGFILKGLFFSIQLTHRDGRRHRHRHGAGADAPVGQEVAGAAGGGIYVNTLRSIPLVMVILWFFLLIPLLIGRPMGAELSAIITFTVFEAAYYSEIMRAGIQSVPGAGLRRLRVGMTYAQCMKLVVVLPQAFRNMLPVLLTQTIILFQDTSLVYAIGAYDLLKGFEVAGKNFNRPVETYLSRRSSTSSSAFAVDAGARLQQKIQIIRREAFAVIDIQNVSKWYGSFQVLTDCTTSIQKGEVVVVCGWPLRFRQESTLIKTVNALEPFQKGDIRRRRQHQRPQDQPAQAAQPRRHGVPALRAVPAPQRHREPDDRADQGARSQPRRGQDARPEDARPRRPDGAQGQVPRPALRRPAAARGDRARCRWTRS